MGAEIRCPSCGEGDDLRGERVDGLILVVCGACGNAWERDPRPRCERCGGTDMRAVPKAVMQKVRGSQRSITGTVTVHLCVSCDDKVIRAQQQSRAPLMPDEDPPARGG